MFQWANLLPCLENADPPVYVSTQSPEISRGLRELVDSMSFLLYEYKNKIAKHVWFKFCGVTHFRWCARAVGRCN